MKRENIEPIEFIKANADLFEKVQDQYQSTPEKYDVDYTCLNYKKIVSQMLEYLKGYIETEDKDKYRFKLISSTKNFFDAMFRDKSYRITFTLSQYPEISRGLLTHTKELVDLMEKCDDSDHEMDIMLKLINNQYTKLSVVAKDDMNIFLWLRRINSKSSMYHDISSELRRKFDDNTTPVIHRK